MLAQAEQSFGEYALEAGRLLLQAKRRLPHGAWAQHIESHTGFSLRTAEVYMRARKRYDQLPQEEKASVLEQPFTRSLLVLAQAPKHVVPLYFFNESADTEILPTEKGNGRSTSDSVENMLRERSIETTALINQAVDYHHEPTPIDDILDGPSKVYTDDEIPDTQSQLDEALKEFERATEEIARLERENRSLQTELEGAQANPNQMRGWDFVQEAVSVLAGGRASENARVSGPSSASH